MQAESKSSNNNAIFFLHIPKTGGQTIHHILRGLHNEDKVLSLTGDRLHKYENLSSNQKSELQVISGHMPFGYHEQFPGDCSYFTLLRDPFERAVSSYKHIKQTPKHAYYQKYRENNITLDQHLDDTLFDNFLLKRILWDHNNPLLTMEVDKSSLDQAIKRLGKYFTFVGLLEKFDESLLILSKIYNWPLPLYKRKNVSPEPDFSLECSQSCLASFVERNLFDFQLFYIVRKQLKDLIEQMGKDFEVEVRDFKQQNKKFQQEMERKF